MTVDVQIACKGGAPPAATIAAWATAALEGDARGLCVRVVGSKESATLNERFRDRPGPTNVLAFPAGENGLLGDIAVCAPVALREAADQRKRTTDHFAHLVVHGVLHLVGLRHDTEAAASAMEAKEAQVLSRLGIENPYGVSV